MRNFIALCLTLFIAVVAIGEEKPGVVSFVKVVSDKVEDVSSLEAWKKSFIQDGMTDEQKALKIWETVVKFRHQNSPPFEYAQNAGHPHDPIRTFNVYGYGQCCCASSNIEGLSRFIGLRARGWAINNHSVPEVWFNDSWHMLDASLITYYFKDEKKSIAGVEEMMANPDGLVNQAHCQFVDEKGWYPAGTHQIKNSPNGYRKKGNCPFEFEYGYSQGYQVNNQLREGERLTRNWFNKGLHVNMDWSDAPGALTAKVGEGDMRYAPKYGDIAPGRIGNGTHEFSPLASHNVSKGALEFTNLMCKDEGAPNASLRVKDANQPGIFVVRMPTSYIYMAGDVSFDAEVSSGGSIAVSFSDDNGCNWREVGNVSKNGAQKLDLKPFVFRRYDYRLKFELKGGAGISNLKITNDIQHSQRALPALGQGENKIAFTAGPAEGTITVEGSINPANQGKQVLLSSFNPKLNGMKFSDTLAMEGGKGDITIPISTPGEMTRLRFGSFYRARDAKDTLEYQVSFDGGKTFKTVETANGPAAGYCKYVTVSDVPAGTKEALVRFGGTQRNTLCIFDIRIDADYKEPFGGFRPVRVTYSWTENGATKQDVHVCKTPDEKYTINCAGKPEMKSIVFELAD